MVIDLQVVGKEKELIFLDRPADIAAEVVVSEMPYGGIEKVARVEIAVLDKFIRSAVIVVCTGLQDDVCNGAAGAAQLGVEITRGNIHRLDRFQWRDDDLQKARTFVIVDALDLVVVALAQLAVDFRLQRVTCVEELRVLES